MREDEDEEGAEVGGEEVVGSLDGCDLCRRYRLDFSHEVHASRETYEGEEGD